MSPAHESRTQHAANGHVQVPGDLNGDPNGDLHGDLNGRLQSQARGMFALLVSMCDGSRKAAALRASVDIRSFDAMRAVPSMDLIARLGRALGLDASAAVDAISADAVGASRVGLGLGLARECMREFVCEADLDDDAFALERAAEVMARQAALPRDLALAHLVRARAMVARGALGPAMHAAEIALDIGLTSEKDHAHDAVVARLAESIVFEAMLGSPCDARPVRSDAVIGAVEAKLARLLAGAGEDGSDARPEHATAIAARREAWRIARRALTSTGSPIDELHELRQATDRAVDRLRVVGADPHSRHDAERALAWTASIASIVALRLHRAGACGRQAMSTIVSSELALDDALDDAFDDTMRKDPSQEELAAITRALFTRRARVAMCEWSTRAELGEIDARTIDGMDLDELVRSSLLFPRARTSRVFDQVNCADGFGEIRQVRKFTLDALSGDCWMLRQVPCLAASWAAGSRSEDPC